MRNYHQVVIALISAALVVGCGASRLSDAEYLQRARDHVTKGEVRAAVIEAKNALQVNADNAEARRLLGEQYVVMGDGSAAEKELRRAQELGAQDAHSRYLLGKALQLQGKSNELLAELKIEKSTQDAASAPLLALRGEALLATQQVEQAEAQIQQASALAPQSPEVLLAIAKLAIVKSDNERALAVLDQLAQVRPNDQEVAYLKAAVIFSQRRYAESETAFQRALEIGPRNTSTLWSLESRVGLVRAQLVTGKTDQALQQLDGLLKTYPDHPVPQYFRAVVAYQMQDYATAQDYLQRVISRNPDHAHSMLLLGAVHYARQNYEQANDYLSRFVAAVPSHIQARKLLAAVRLKLDRPKDAVEALATAAEATPNDAELLAMIGRAVAQSGDVKKGSAYLRQAATADPSSASIRAELARVYMAQGAYDDALKELSTIDGSAQAKAMMVYAHLQKRDFAAARKLTQELVSGSTDPAMFVLAGIVELAAGERHQARGRFAEALKSNNSFIPAYLNLARMDMEDGDFAEAGKRFERVLAIDAKNIAAMLGLAQIAEQRRDLEETLAWLEQARAADEKALLPRLVLSNYFLRRREPKKALDIAQEAAKFHAQDPRVLVLLEQVHLALGNASEALASSTRLVDKWPNVPGAHLEHAKVLMQLKRYTPARDALKRALQLKPDFLQAKVVLAIIELESNNAEQALKIAHDVQQKDELLGLSLAGDVHLRSKDYARAKDAYSRALTRRPLPELVMKVAEVERAMGQSSQAMATLQRWLKDHPDDVRIGMALAAHYQAAGRNGEAVSQLRRVVELQPDNAAALNNLAWLAHMQRDPTALQYAEKAHKLMPQDGAIADTLGWLLVQENKDIPRAVELLRKASQQVPQLPAIRYHYATALAKAGATIEAKATLSSLLSEGQQFDEIEDARRLLKQLP
jgi:putative PEP-CTERM system TPR-repeat lipoprotein